MDPAERKIFLAALVFALAAFAVSAEAADAIRVLKTSGSRATVEFLRPDGAGHSTEPGISPEPGQVYWLSPSRSLSGRSLESRGNTAAISAELSAMTESRGQVTSTTVALQGKYGWNLIDWEAGPASGLTYSQSDPNSFRRIEAGGFGDWNFVPNHGRELVYGATGAFRLGHTERARGAARYSNNLIGLDTGFALKWFALRAASACIRADLLYSYESEVGDGPFAVTSTGFRALTGLQIYF